MLSLVFPTMWLYKIHVEYSKYTIKHVVVDEGTATCLMSLVCWKSLDSPTLSKSSKMLTTFEGHSFRPHDILPTFSVQLGGKTVEVEVEVVDAPLEYNLLLGCSWTYAMIVIMSFIFCTLCFTHEGKIVTIDQLSSAYSIPNASLGQSIPVINNSRLTTENIDVGMYSSLMGTFNFSAPNHQVYAMSSRSFLTGRSVPFYTSYFDDLWTLPSPTLSCEGQLHAGMAMPLSTTEITYQAILNSSAEDLVPSPIDEEDLMSRPVWATLFSCLEK
jgi:hypothetical protein